jgi:chromate reductase
VRDAVATNPLRNKPVAVVGASTGAFGAVWSQAETRKVLKAIGARVVDAELPVGFAAAQLGDGGLEPPVSEGLASVLSQLTASVEQRRDTALAAA